MTFPFHTVRALWLIAVCSGVVCPVAAAASQEGRVVPRPPAAAADPRDHELLVEEAAHYRDEGRRAQAAGQVDQAITAYSKAVLSFPEYADAHNDLGVMYEANGDLVKAEASYQRALAAAPRHGAAHMNLALLYEHQGKIDQAALHWQERVRVGPADNPWVRQARELLIKYRLKVPEPAEALDAKRQGQAALAYEEGMFYLDRRRWAQAQEAFQKALAVDPGHRGARNGLAVAQRKVRLGPPPSSPFLSSMGAPSRGTTPTPKQARKPTPVTPLTPRAPAVDSTRPREQASRSAEAALVANEIALRKQRAPVPPPLPMPAPRPMASPLPAPQPPARPATPAALPKPELRAAPIVAATTPKEAQQLAEQLAREKQRTRDLMVRELYQRGLILYRQKQYAQAIEQFQRALTINPDHRESQESLREAQAALARG